MIVEASNVGLSLDAMAAQGDGRARREVARALGVKERAIVSLELVKRSVDARKKARVHFVTTWRVALVDGVRPAPAKGVNVREASVREALCVPDCAEAFAASGDPRPVVVGAGPAGLFAALYLARAGLRPVVVERGAAVEERVRIVDAFNDGAPLDTGTNIQFGEGGAGTFSDGKLNTGTKSPHIRHVLEAFVEAGAPREILVDAKPHIGTDKLVGVVRALREEIMARGGEVRFLTQLTGLELAELPEGGARVAGVRLRDVASGGECVLPARCVVLACGHSARDTFEMAREAGVSMERKPFAVGVRIEHPQKLIDRVQYGAAAGHAALGAADYKLAVHTRAGRGVYTFCMCPGGEVVAAASEEGGVCTNGMSRHARDGENANSALLVSIEPEDLPGDDVLEGVAFQRSLEQAAYRAGAEAAGVPYTAPAQTVGDFLAGRCGSASTLVVPTHPRGVAWVDLHECLPPLVTDALHEAFPLLDAKLRGFAHKQAVLTGVEARSSSPVRLVRDAAFQARLDGRACGDEQGAGDALQRGVVEPASTTADDAAAGAAGAAGAVANGVVPGDARVATSGSGLYPCGEGAGYAGGIMSAAVDGLRVAEAIAARYALAPAAEAADAPASDAAAPNAPAQVSGASAPETPAAPSAPAAPAGVPDATAPAKPRAGRGA